MSAISKTLKFTGGLLAGVGIGTLTALLLAPQSGNLTREQVQARLDEVLDAGRRAARQTEDELYSRWETEMSAVEPGKSPEEAAAERARKAEEKARKQEEDKRKEAERHIAKANDELEKARKSI